MAIDRVGVSDILVGYDMYKDCPYYAFFEDAKGHDLKYVYKDGDRPEGKKLLMENLKALEQKGTEAVFVIRFYEELPDKKDVNWNTPCSGSQRIKIKETATMVAMAAQQAGGSDFTNFLMKQLDNEKEARENLEDELSEIKELLLEKEKTPPDEAGLGIIGQIGRAATSYPVFGEILKDWSTVLKHKFMAFAGPAQASNIAGVETDTSLPPDQRVNNAIRKLIEYYIRRYGGTGDDETKRKTGFTVFAADMELLANLTSDPDVMDLALKKLRAMA